MDMMLAHATTHPSPATIETLVKRAERVSREVADRRDQFQIETPWTSLTRLIYDACGLQFTLSLDRLELLFWNACITTRPMAGVLDALNAFRRAGIPMGVVSNSSFSQAALRHELAKHGLADFLTVIVASAEYAVRKPNPLLFECAASLLGVACSDVWFIGDRVDTDVAGARAAGMTPIWYSATAKDGSRPSEQKGFTWSEIVTAFQEASQ
jgi:putative hydrolase of the HAD superfamily